MEIVPWFLRIIVEKTLQTRTILYGVVCRRVGNGSKNTFQFQRERVVSAFPFQFICSMISKMGRVSSASQPRRVGFKKKNLARVFIFLVCEKEISIFPFSLSCLFGGCSWVGRRRRGRRAAGGADRRDRGHRSAAAENDARSAGQEEEECGVQDGGRRRRRDGAAAAARRRLGLGRRLRFLHDPRRRYICEPRPFFHFFWGGGHRIEESIAEWSTLFSKQFRRKQTVRFVSVKGRKGVLSSFTGFYLFLMGFTGF